MPPLQLLVDPVLGRQGEGVATLLVRIVDHVSELSQVPPLQAPEGALLRLPDTTGPSEQTGGVHVGAGWSSTCQLALHLVVHAELRLS